MLSGVGMVCDTELTCDQLQELLGDGWLLHVANLLPPALTKIVIVVVI